MHLKILVCGGGIAGLSTGIALGRAGHRVTIVERAHHLRVNGSPIDIRGESLPIAEHLGLLGEIRARRVEMTALVQFVDEQGRVQAQLPEVGDSPDDVEIPREDLARILTGALPDTATLRYGDSIATLHDDGAGVDVTFEAGGADRYDLVVGADGLHSRTRRLTFGPERDYLRHLGFYIALCDLPAEAEPDRINPFLNRPGLLAGIARYRDRALGVFTFRSPPIAYDHHDLDAQKRILTETYADHRVWKIPELIKAAQADPELYFDAVAQIDMPTWHRGRVVLVGDAAHCASGLSGRGASLALTGAWHLADALRHHSGDPNRRTDDLETALHDYERRQRPFATRAQATAAPGGDLIVPATEEAIEARNRRLNGAEEAPHGRPH